MASFTESGRGLSRFVRSNPLVRSWWSFVLRGVFAILFGILTFALPQLTLGVLITVFAAYALVDGVIALAGAVRDIRTENRALMLLLEGIVSIGAAIVALVAPGITAVVLLYVIAFWAIVTGCLELASAIRLRNDVDGEWLLGFSGVLSILFGFLLVASPSIGALAVVYQIGLYAAVFGGVLIALGLRLRRFAAGKEALRDRGGDLSSRGV